MVNNCMKTLREYIEILDEISRRDFLKGAGATAGLAATGKAGAWTRDQRGQVQLSDEDWKHIYNAFFLYILMQKGIIHPGKLPQLKAAIQKLVPLLGRDNVNRIFGGAKNEIKRSEDAGEIQLFAKGILMNGIDNIIFDVSGIAEFEESTELDEAGTPDAVARILELSKK